jgi:hypothetical protein
MRTHRNHPALLLSVCLTVLTLFASLVPTLQADEHKSDLFVRSLPEDTVLYVDVRNIKSHLDNYEGKIIDQMSDDQRETYQSRKKKLLNQLSSRANEEMGVDPANLLSHVTRVRMAVVSSKLDLGATSEPSKSVEDASFLLSAEVDQADVVSQMLTGDVADRLSREKSVNDYTIYRIKMPEEAKEAPASYFLHRKKTLYVTEDLDRLTAIAEGPDSGGFPENSLAKNESFQESVAAETSSSDVVDAYMNIASFWEQLEGSLEKRQKMYYQQAAKILGFEEMKHVSMSLDWGDEKGAYELAVHLSGEEFPLYDLLLQADPGPLSLLKSIPADAMTGSASRIPDYAERLSDIKKKVVEGMTMFGQKKKQANQQWNMGMMMVKKQLGVGLKKLLGHLGGQMAYYVHAPEDPDAVSDPQMYNVKNGVVRLSLEDGEQFLKMFENKIRSSSGYKTLKKMESTTTHNDVKLYTYKAQNDMKPAMFVRNDQLVLAGSTSKAKADIDRKTNQASSVAGTSWFQNLRTELPRRLTYLQFVENKKYTKYAQTIQKQALEQNDMWSSNLFSGDLFQNLYSSLDSETGVLIGASTSKDRILMNGTGEINLSGVNPDALNDLLKSWTENLKEQEQNDQNDNEKEDEEKNESETESY